MMGWIEDAAGLLILCAFCALFLFFAAVFCA